MNESIYAAASAIIQEFEQGTVPPDPRVDIDTPSLVARFPHLAAVEVTDMPLPATGGSVPTRLYRASGEARAALVWVHGGAFIAGDLDAPESNWVALELAARGIPVLAVDYRKALHGVRFPAMSDDVLAAWEVASTTSEELFGVDASRLHLGGASAGGNLTAGITLRLRDSGGIMPASLLLVYPFLHPAIPEPSAEAAAVRKGLPATVWNHPDAAYIINSNYVGPTGSLEDPVAFPGLSQLDGLPPTRILIAEIDVLRPSGELFAEQLRAAGVPVEIVIEPAAEHGHLDQPGLPTAVRSLDRIRSWLSAEG